MSSTICHSAHSAMSSEASPEISGHACGKGAVSDADWERVDMQIRAMRPPPKSKVLARTVTPPTTISLSGSSRHWGDWTESQSNAIIVHEHLFHVKKACHFRGGER